MTRPARPAFERTSDRAEGLWIAFFDEHPGDLPLDVSWEGLDVEDVDLPEARLIDDRPWLSRWLGPPWGGLAVGDGFDIDRLGRCRYGTVVRGTWPDPPDLGHLVATMAILQAFARRGALAILDPMGFRWWSGEALLAYSLDRPFRVRDHVGIVLRDRERTRGVAGLDAGEEPAAEVADLDQDAAAADVEPARGIALEVGLGVDRRVEPASVVEAARVPDDGSGRPEGEEVVVARRAVIAAGARAEVDDRVAAVPLGEGPGESGKIGHRTHLPGLPGLASRRAPPLTVSGRRPRPRPPRGSPRGWCPDRDERSNAPAGPPRRRSGRRASAPRDTR